MDRYLDTTRTGPQWLRHENVAQSVTEHIRDAEDYRLYAWVLMPNHVHILVEPLIDPSEMMRRIKGRSARAANLLLGRTGQPFWAADSYDHWIRNPEERRKTWTYIVNNPVRAGLVARAEDYRWSSAFGR
jgi:putative DNA methylase